MSHPAPYDTTLSFRRANKGSFREATCHACKVSHVWTGKPEPANALCPTCAKPIRGAGRAAWHRSRWIVGAPTDMTAPPPEPKPAPPAPDPVVIEAAPEPEPLHLTPKPQADSSDAKKKSDTDLVLKEKKDDEPDEPDEPESEPT